MVFFPIPAFSSASSSAFVFWLGLLGDSVEDRNLCAIAFMILEFYIISEIRNIDSRSICRDARKLGWRQESDVLLLSDV
ncbi:hypothetical protein M5K25_004498 [Dendrobium thyrsiflorum]|uniref:Secreted protein n=1 Tax=Dendrobium thyrsiflorum TaxID=117978 RepID=A0ABD0VN81_DENTH